MDHPNAKRLDGQACALGGRHEGAEIATTPAPRGETPDAMPVDLAHDFSNLLTILLGSLEPLRRQPLDDRGQQQLARAEESTRQLCALLSRCSPSSGSVSRWQPHEPD